MAQPYFNQLLVLMGDIQLDDDGLHCKHFFSGAALYQNGRICASLTPKGLALKLPGPRCATLIAEGKAAPLQYFDNSPIKKGYVLFPNYQDFSHQELAAYFNECLAYAGAANG